jgi:beta-phosphoglucomutase-like phosphatase (HAD superfamily)
VTELQQVRLIAIDCDGVLIDDTYLAVIERFITERGGDYDDETERSIIGLRDVVVADLMARACGLDQPVEATLADIWAERELHLREHPIAVTPGASALLASLRDLGARVVCYGGRTREHTFDTYLGGLADFLDSDLPYIGINEHRPGVDHIVRDVIGCEFGQAVFVDDVSRVAQAARARGAGFIGFPSSPAHHRQRRFMTDLGVRHIVDSLAQITPELLTRVDAELATMTHWRETATAFHEPSDASPG